MQRTLANGLILRSLSEGYDNDRERLPPFYREVYQAENYDDVELIVGWVIDLISGRHPTVTADDVWYVVDPAQGDRIVSGLLSIPQVWRYEEARLKVARPELVATLPDYRRRGLVRALMDAAHERAAETGCNVQGITGIPHFYRQFGYGMAVELGAAATMALSLIDPLPEGQTAAYTFRFATAADIPRLIACEEWAAQDCLLSVVRDEAMWRYQFSIELSNSLFSTDYLIIHDAQNVSVGYVMARKNTFDKALIVDQYIVGPDSSYLATFADVLRNLKTHVENRFPPEQRPTMMRFDRNLHPAVTTLLERRMAAIHHRGYAWYLRAASPAQLMRDIAPVLERRLEGSGAHRYTGEIKIDFFNFRGLAMRFESGRLVDAQDAAIDNPDARFPWDTFLNIVFGHHNYQQIQAVLPETYASGTIDVLFHALFPRKRSSLYPID